MSSGSAGSRTRSSGGLARFPESLWQRTLFAGALAMTATLAIAAGPALAGGGTAGAPQPELAQFKVGSATTGSGDGTGAVLPDGTILLASLSNSGKTISVCRLILGGRSCASTAVLSAYSGDLFYGTAEVLVTGPSVTIVAEDCCHLPPYSGGAVVFDSTDGGATFSALTAAGKIQGGDAATVFGGQPVVATSQSSSLNVQTFPATGSPGPVSAFATPRGGADGNTALASASGGLLVASDNVGGTVFVEYVAPGGNPNAKSSYKSVGSFKGGYSLEAASGNAVLLNHGGGSLGGQRLSFFNGTSMGALHTVPEPKGGDDHHFAIQKAGSLVHVFFLNYRLGYALYSETTTDGVHWSSFVIYHSAITSTDLAPVLDPAGAGVVFEAGTSAHAPLAQPILLPQVVHIALAHSSVTAGTSTSLTGSASPHLASQLVALQKLTSGLWYTVTTTHETSGGTFSFTVPGATMTYRAVVANDPGLYLYGYSNTATLTVVP
jgi:hypothetical protein